MIPAVNQEASEHTVIETTGSCQGTILGESKFIVSDLFNGTSVTDYWTPPLTSASETASKGILLTPTLNPSRGQTEFRFSLPADNNA